MDFQSFLLLGTDSVSGDAMLTSDTATIMYDYGWVQEIRFNPDSGGGTSLLPRIEACKFRSLITY